MSDDNASWDLDVLGRQVGPHRAERLDLESRVDWSERFVSQHDREIKQTRHETSRRADELENRIWQQGQLIERQGRLIQFLADVLFAVIAALFGGLVAAYVPGDILDRRLRRISISCDTLGRKFPFQWTCSIPSKRSLHETAKTPK